VWIEKSIGTINKDGRRRQGKVARDPIASRARRASPPDRGRFSTRRRFATRRPIPGLAVAPGGGLPRRHGYGVLKKRRIHGGRRAKSWHLCNIGPGRRAARAGRREMDVEREGAVGNVISGEGA
jgi:hypothetical protein